MYKFKNTEINNKKASEFETKALLYLLGMKKDSDEIEYITVDCFNDVTGCNNDFTKLWDIQSKNHKSLPPSKIGESLFTLYDNYISKIDFVEYILFIPKLERRYLVDENLSIYDYSNIQKSTKIKIEVKLKSEIIRIHKLDDFFNLPKYFHDFLNHLIFVEDNKQLATYIKKIAKFKNKKIFPTEFYENIFLEIRDKQSALKNSYIANEIISKPKDVLDFNRHITKKEINTLLISRFVGVEIFTNNGIPIKFLPIINLKDMDEEGIKDFIQECNENLCRAFFDKNDNKNFWNISEFIVMEVKSYLQRDIQVIYEKLLNTMKIRSYYLTKDTILYMISLVIQGVENDN